MNALLCLCCLMLFWRVKADCQLKAEDFAQTNRIFAFDDGGKLQLLRVDVVPTHQTLDLICNDNDVVQTTCQLDGNFNPSLPQNDCSNPTKASVEVIPDASCPYSMYRVGYKLNDDEFLELYRSCYDVPHQTAHFVIHQTYPSSLEGRPDQGFTTDGVITGAQAASFQAKNIYARFNELLGSQQTYVSSARDLVFDRGHLAPSADFGFEAYMRLSFKYINVVAQFRGINRSNWKSIENWVRRQLSDNISPALQLCTGGFDVLQLPHSQTGVLTSIYLLAPQGNPVPKWLYKIVSDGAGTRYAFLTYNNVHDTTLPTPNCQQVACPATLQLTATKEAGLTFCCDPSDFITRNVPHLATVC